jgi:signal transduction histidine kinase
MTSRWSSHGSAGHRRRVKPPLRDIWFAVVVWLVDMVVVSDVDPTLAGVGTAAVAAICYVPLAWRSVAPMPAFFGIFFLAIGAALLVPAVSPTAGLLVANYSVASHSDRRTAVGVCALSVLAGAAIAVRSEVIGNPQVTSLRVAAVIIILTASLNLGPFVLGRWAQRSRRQIEDLEASRTRAAEEARVEERRLMAREVHDVLAHGFAVVVLQADGARAQLPENPGKVAEALEHISQVGRSSISELRLLMGVLADGAIAEVPSAQLGLADLPALMVEAERTGLAVTFEIQGRPRAVPASFERSVHRIVKESLANARKHGGPGTEVKVTMFWADRVLILTTADNGAGRATDPSLSTGHGLPGLRERVRALEGRLDAGASPNGTGFVVTATLPIPASAAIDDHDRSGQRT